MFKFVVGLLVLLLICSVPILILRSIIYMHRRGWQSDATSGVGNALQELDRLVGRPTVEHQIQAQNEQHKPDENIGGE